MILSKFYKIIDKELLNILEQHSSDNDVVKHKNIDQNKGYALLVWFLKFYGQKDLFKSYITDGKDDNSCDIIFSNVNSQNEKIFYIIQSKWVRFDGSKREDAYPIISKQEFGYTLNDFNNVLSSEKQKGKNEEFNRKYDELKDHLENNGKAKFIFFTLADFNTDIEESIGNFNKTFGPNVSLEVIDIKRIKRDYIDFKFKEVTTNNPLEYSYNPENIPVEIEIERLNDKRDILEFDGRAEAYIFVLKPHTIFTLFDKYKFGLFFKNVRNPIHRSNYNKKIVETLVKKPQDFWYFNNGITAITKLMPKVGVHAKTITVEGLQIINGAQTVYSIYQAYKDASPSDRRIMDAYAKVTFRLIGSVDEDFNMQITRYTNMQNPLDDRDFWANDEVQQRLQNESFLTNIWYEKRRDEFRLSEEEKEKLGIKTQTNAEFAPLYLAYQLQKPSIAISRDNKIFTSRKDDKDGLYEEIFNEKTRYIDMLAAFYIHTLIDDLYIEDETFEDNDSDEDTFRALDLSALALSKIVLQKYFNIKKNNPLGKDFKVNEYLIELIGQVNEKSEEIRKVVHYCLDTIEDYVKKDNDSSSIRIDKVRFQKLIDTTSFYDRIVEDIEEHGINIAAIDSIDLSDYKKD